MRRLLALLAAACLVPACGGGSGGSGGGASDPGPIPPDPGPIPVPPGMVGRIPADGWTGVDITWQDPGGWTTIDVTTAGISATSTTTQTSAIQALINASSAPTILYFPPGTYRTGTLTLRNNLIIRGAGDSTVFLLQGTGGAFRAIGQGGQWDWPYMSAEYQPRSVLASVPPGGTEVTIASTMGLAVGDTVVVEGALAAYSFPSAKWSRGGIFHIAAISGNTITLDLPLGAGLPQATGSDVSRVAKLNPRRNVGIESLKIVPPASTSAGGADAIYFVTCENAYIKNVTSVNAISDHLMLVSCNRIVMSGCFFDYRVSTSSNNGYGILLEALCTRILITDNIMKDLRPPVAWQTGCNYVVYSYNMHVDRLRDYVHATNDPAANSGSWIQSASLNGIMNGSIPVDVVFHGNYPHTNLVEGNVFYGAVVDYDHLTNGPWNTFYRNRVVSNPDHWNDWLEGIALWIDGPSDNQNFIGNHLLHSGLIQEVTHNGPVLPTGTFIAANVRASGVEWGDLPAGTALPSSLYRTTRPDFFPATLAWPPFGPGVAGSATNKIPAELRWEAMAP
jgi:hypothetical protein